MTPPEPTPASPLEHLRVIGWNQMKAGQEWVRARELSLQQAFVLSYLAEQPGAIQRDIARATRTTAANVSGVLQVLEGRNLVERRSEPGNDRSKRVYATAAGVALLAGRDEAMAAVDEAILAPLTRTERATFQALLDKIVAELPGPDPA